jgi:hypothetical protein
MQASGRLRADRSIATSWRPIRPPGRCRLLIENVASAQSSAGHSNCAGFPFGATEAAMSLHGFTRPILVRLIRAGLATVQREKAGGQLVDRVRITDAGRRAIEGY